MFGSCFLDGNGGGSAYFMGGFELRVVGRHKDLGVLVDRSLKFLVHVNNIVRKASGLANNLL